MRMIPNLNKLSKDPKVKKFVVVGCGRSGTLYMTKVFEILGYKVGHEGFNKNGICSWYLGEKDRSRATHKIMAGHDVKYIHLVRNPVKVISSMYNIDLTRKRSGLDIFRRGFPQYNHLSGTPSYVLIWWIIWNRECKKNYNFDYTIKVEDFKYKGKVNKFCKGVNLKYSEEMYQKIQSLGQKVHTTPKRKIFNPELTFEDLKSENKRLALQLKKVAYKYGYRL